MTLIQIGEYIDRKQARPFIKVYLTCLAQGYQLTCPINTDKDELFKSWEKVLAKYRDNFTDEFCQDVTNNWHGLLKRCDMNSSQIELQLFKLAGISEEELRETRRGVTVDVKKKMAGEIPENREGEQSKVDSLTTPEISESYKQRKLADDVSLPEVDKLDSVYKKSIKQKDVAQFLISHLTYSKYNIEKEVPRSTVPLVIREKWESIIANEFNTIPDDYFLAELTNEWFYLVNQRGIPSRLEDIEELLMTFLTKQQKNKDNPKPKKQQSILGKLFGS